MKDKAWNIYWRISSFLLQHHLGLNFPAHFEVSSKHQPLVTELNLKSLMLIHLQSVKCFMQKISTAPKAQAVTRPVPIRTGFCFRTVSPLCLRAYIFHRFLENRHVSTEEKEDKGKAEAHLQEITD